MESEVWIIEVSANFGKNWKPDQSEGFKKRYSTAATRAERHQKYLHEQCHRLNFRYRVVRYLPAALAQEAK